VKDYFADVKRPCFEAKKFLSRQAADTKTHFAAFYNVQAGSLPYPTDKNKTISLSNVPN
jgi:hypothetical protein